MPVSEKQKIANRENAKKSTGPKTDEGKLKASRNSIKHGLYAKDIIINSPHLKEDEKEYLALVDSLFDELKPDSLMEQYFAMNIANCLWRSKRIVNAETAQINRQLEHVDSDYESDKRFEKITGIIDEEEYESDEYSEDDLRKLSNLINLKSIPSNNLGENIVKYEMRVSRQLSRLFNNYSRLKRLKKQQNEPISVSQEKKNTL